MIRRIAIEVRWGANPAVVIGSHPFFDPEHGANTNVVLRVVKHHRYRTPKCKLRIYAKV
jgi:hypothetical protein